MKGDKLGEFEELVLLTVHILGDEAYGVSIL
ncbi:MAG TPA: PadR family transcriptional regulator, partial [Acidobacteriota bacterium]|nr:PadR family transcriptional regulator [Acidobacteriota bacterium]HSR53081.1 PadR family transcriptional regulator [Acidobacteriota bacterium]